MLEKLYFIEKLSNLFYSSMTKTDPKYLEVDYFSKTLLAINKGVLDDLWIFSMKLCAFHLVQNYCMYQLHIGSYMNAHVLLNL